MISIVVPCYNAAYFIKETLDSILSQSIEALEVIIIDDGSTDGSAEVIRSIKDTRLQYTYQHNKGVSAARNNGLKKAQGEYIIFFDADDKMSPDFLNKRKKVLDDEPQLGFCCGSVITFPKVSPAIFGTAQDVAGDLLLYRPQFSSCPSNYLIRRSVLVNNGIAFNEALSSTADRFFLLQLDAKSKGALIKGAPLYYRVTLESMSNKLTNNLILDNEKYYLELNYHKLVPEVLRCSFEFKIQYILGLGFLKTGSYFKGLKYTLGAFVKQPIKFIRQII